MKVDPALLVVWRDYVKAGLTGNAYLLTGAEGFPERLAPRLPDARG